MSCQGALLTPVFDHFLKGLRQHMLLLYAIAMAQPSVCLLEAISLEQLDGSCLDYALLHHNFIDFEYDGFMHVMIWFIIRYFDDLVPFLPVKLQ